MKDLLYWLTVALCCAGSIGLLCLIWPEKSTFWVFICSVNWFAFAFYSWVRYGPSLRSFLWRGPPPWYVWLMARRRSGCPVGGSPLSSELQRNDNAEGDSRPL